MRTDYQILIIRQNPKKWADIKQGLENKGYIVFDTKSVETARISLQKSSFDIILLEEDLEGIDHHDVIMDLKKDHGVPVIVISSENTRAEEIVSLEIGADDYIYTPIDAAELNARIKAILRLVKQTQQKSENSLEPEHFSGEIIEFGDWILDPARFEVTDKRNKSPLNLTQGELDLLMAFLRHPGRALSRDQLFSLTRRDDQDGYDRAVDVQVSRLRQKLGDHDDKAAMIKTVRGIGYMLDTQIRKNPA